MSAVKIKLKSGQFPLDTRIDRVDEKDPKSRQYPVKSILSPKHYTRLRSYTWRPGPTLNQGTEGACVGFAWAHELAARPSVIKDVTEHFARHTIYFEAQKRDRYPGGAYPGALPYMAGTSVIAGAKVLQSLGFISEYRWAFDFWDLVASIGYKGPAVFGCKWSSMMSTLDEAGFAKPEGHSMGKHCILIIGVKILKTKSNEISLDRSFFTFQNSWGKDWGKEGIGKLSFTSVIKLWENAETCIPIKRHTKPI